MNERRAWRLLAVLVLVYAMFGWSTASANDPDDAGGVIATVETTTSYTSTGAVTSMTDLAATVTIGAGQFRCVRTVVTLRVQTSTAPSTAAVTVKRTVAGSSTSASVSGASQWLGAAAGPGATSMVVVGTEMLNEGTYTYTPQVQRSAGVGTIATGNTLSLPQRFTVEDLGDATTHSCFTVL